jgi:hypothetical protein
MARNLTTDADRASKFTELTQRLAVNRMDALINKAGRLADDGVYVARAIPLLWRIFYSRSTNKEVKCLLDRYHNQTVCGWNIQLFHKTEKDKLKNHLWVKLTATTRD